MKKLLILLLIVGCVSFGVITPSMKNYMEELKANNIPFMIVDIDLSPKTKLSRTINMHLRFTSNKIIKYITPTFTLFNAVGDTIKNINGENYFTEKSTGPYQFGNKLEYLTWLGLISNYSMHCIKIESFKIEYMDKSKEIFEGDKIEQLYAPNNFRIDEFEGVCSNSPAQP